MIGLATPYQTNNYGTKLQSFALENAVMQMGYDCEVIQYSFGEPRRTLKNLLAGGVVKYRIEAFKRKRNIEKFPDIKSGMEVRKKAFEDFTNKNYVLSPRCNTLKETGKMSEKYDAVVCGSDQIWLPSHIIQNFYTLNFLPKEVKKIAYAPSFGVGTIPRLLKKEYRNYLQKFDVLTVRENRGRELVKELVGIDCEQVVDPTLLFPDASWNDMLQLEDEKVEERYVFMYFIGQNPEHRRVAREYAEKHHLKLIGLPNIDHIVPADTEFADDARYDISPREFVRLIRDADAVFTDSFHGSVFSILFHKELFVFERFAKNHHGSTNSRIYSLLSFTGLEHRLVSDLQSGILENTGGINYENVDKRVDELRNKSVEILTRALKENEHS